MIMAVLAGLMLKISTIEWCVILLACGAVLALEAVNTAIEEISNMMLFKWNDVIKRIKDLAAGATLIMAIFSLVVGIEIFVPKILLLSGIDLNDLLTVIVASFRCT